MPRRPKMTRAALPGRQRRPGSDSDGEKPLEEIENRPLEQLRPVPWLVALYATAIAAVVLGLGIIWAPLDDASRNRGIEGLPRPVSTKQVAHSGKG